MATHETSTALTFVGLGEALFDVFPDHRHLGGAPLNLAACAQQLAQKHRGGGIVASRIGEDTLGRELLDAMQQRNLTANYIQSDPGRPTGTVQVTLDATGQPSYDIVRDVAWDALDFSPSLKNLAENCHAVAFGSLAQRDAISRDCIHRFLLAATQAVRLLDVNLRQNYFNRDILHRSCELASIIKLNEEELPVVCDLLGITDTSDAAAHALRANYEVEMIALTRGERGTRLYTADGIIDGQPARYPMAEGADAVGAGDACGAGLLVGRVLNRTPQQIADLANRCGAYVASQPGGTPTLPDELIASV